MLKMCKKYNLFFLLAILAFEGMVPNYIYSVKTDKDKKVEKKAAIKREAKPPEPELKLVERIRLVLKFGNSSQIRDSFEKIKTLKPDEQKSLIPQLKELLTSKDVSIQKAWIQAIFTLLNRKVDVVY